MVIIYDVIVIFDFDDYGGVEIDNGFILDDLFYSYGVSNGDVFIELIGFIIYVYGVWCINL